MLDPHVVNRKECVSIEKKRWAQMFIASVAEAQSYLSRIGKLEKKLPDLSSFLVLLPISGII